MLSLSALSDLKVVAWGGYAQAERVRCVAAVTVDGQYRELWLCVLTSSSCSGCVWHAVMHVARQVCWQFDENV